ncbi:MAG: LapA family protein [Paracoccaceae bacterium]
MRYLKYALLALVTIAILVVSLANRDVVTLVLFPNGLAGPIGFNLSVNLPLFIVIFISVAAGLILGIILEWVREYRFRAEGARSKKELRRAHKELKSDTPKDPAREILDLVEKA